MSFLPKNRLLLIPFFYLLFVVGAILVAMTNSQVSQSRYTKRTIPAVLSFSPTTIHTTTGETINFAVKVNPGEHPVSLITLDILYDSSKLMLDKKTGIQINTAAFPTLLEQPMISPGRIRIKVSIGTNLAHVIRFPTTVAVMHIKTIKPNDTLKPAISFGAGSSVQSTDPQGITTENILSQAYPAQIYIVNATPIDPGIKLFTNILAGIFILPGILLILHSLL